MTAEEWRPIPGCPYYYATSLGRIVSCHPRWKRPRVLKGGFLGGKRDYRAVLVVNDGEAKTRSVHSLVAEAFHGPRPRPGMQVRHLDGDKLNNRPGNLRWGTPRENSLDCIEHGTHPNASKVRCIHGHDFDERNTYVDRHGRRHCRACRRRAARDLRIRSALRAAGVPAA